MKKNRRESRTMVPSEIRERIREGSWAKGTEGICSGYVQANLAIVPKDLALDFMIFCIRNPRPCPIIEVLDPGDPVPRQTAPTSDLRTDLPRYLVYQNGIIIDEPTDITKYWRDDLVAFLLGCSLSFDQALTNAKIKHRFLGAYTTDIPCETAGIFHGPLVVSCRLIKGSTSSVRAIHISSRYTFSHGAPVHIGNPETIGIKDLCNPDMGRSSLIQGEITPPAPDEMALFWGCGVTSQAVALSARPTFMITHAPGYMFVTDRRAGEMAVF